MFEHKELVKKIAIGLFSIFCAPSDGMGKVLKCPQVSILNIALEDKPYVIARIKLAYKNASQVFKLLMPAEQKDVAEIKNDTQKKAVPVIDGKREIEEKFEALILHASDKKIADKKVNVSSGDAFVKEKQQYMLGPVKEFFGEIREYTALIEPLLKESLEGTGVPLEKSHLYAFVKSTEDLLPFFEQRIHSHDDLRAFASEFKSLFGDLHDSLSADALKKYDKFISDLKGKRTQPVKN